MAFNLNCNWGLLRPFREWFLSYILHLCTLKNNFVEVYFRRELKLSTYFQQVKISAKYLLKKNRNVADGPQEFIISRLKILSSVNNLLEGKSWNSLPTFKKSHF